MRFTTSQTSFKAGRLSPKLYNRVDTSQYREGASVVSGMRPIAEGGLERVSGSILHHFAEKNFWEVPGNVDASDIQEVRSHSFTTYLGTFLIVFVRYTNNAVVFNLTKHPYEEPYAEGIHGETPTTLIFPGSTTYLLSHLDFATVKGSLVITHHSGTLNPVILTPTPKTGLEDKKPFRFARMFSAGFDANSPSPPPLTLGFAQLNSSPFYRPVSDGISITLSNVNTTNKTIEITSSNTAAVEALQKSTYIYAEGLGSNNFGGDANQLFIIANYYKKIEDITNGIRCYYRYTYKNTEALNFGGVTSTDIWLTNRWGPDLVFPRTVCHYEGRLVFGGDAISPTAIFGSKVGDELYFNRIRYPKPGTPYLAVPSPSGDTVATDPYEFTLSTKESSRISFVNSYDTLIVGTDTGEFSVTGGDTIISTYSINSKNFSRRGSYPCASETTTSGVVFISSDRKKLYRIRYSRENGSSISEDLTVLFNDFVEGEQIRGFAWAAYHSTLYILIGEKLYGFVDNPDTGVTAFFYTGQEGLISISGPVSEVSNSTPTARLMAVRKSPHYAPMNFSSLFSILSVDPVTDIYGKDHVSDGAPEKSLHRFTNQNIFVERTGEFTFKVGNVNVFELSNLFPLPAKNFRLGDTVYVLNMDTGESQEVEVNVEAGNFNLLNHPFLFGASSIIVGSEATEAMVATLPVEAGQQWGTAQMGIKNIDTLGLRYYKSYSIEVSNDENNWMPKVLADNDGNAKTGRITFKHNSSPDYDQIIWLRNTKPEPLTIVGLNMRGVSNDG